MATVVLNTEESTYFAPSTLRRSHSQPKFISGSSDSQTPTSPVRKPEDYTNLKIYPDSAPSSASSSPRIAPAESTDFSYASTPTSNLSLSSECDDIHPDDHFLPHYPQAGYYDTEDLEPPASPKTGDSYNVSPAEPDNSDDTSRPATPEFKLEVDRAEDDTAVRQQPTRHVDYLSHTWKEEDIWSSWRYVVNKRSEYSNSARLENAAWRTWMKAKNNLRTVSPETLNWLKDCDVTWLYGPLQTGPNALAPGSTDQNSGVLSKNNSFIDKKPILKKRSMSEIMLQKSISASSLIKTAAAAVQAQEMGTGRRVLRPALARAHTDFSSYGTSSRRLSGGTSSAAASTQSSGLMSPNAEERHIHFNESVEQCIAVEAKGEDDFDEELDSDNQNDSDSDDGAIMMKRSRTKKRTPLKRRKTKSGLAPAEGKTIAKLPSTTLKYREDTQANETAMKHSVYGASSVSPSSSQETLRPAKSSTDFLFDEDEDAEEAILSPRGDRPSFFGDDTMGLNRTPSSSSLHAEPAGMRRTPSGMFMPYEEGEAAGSDGMFGRVVDTVNTARDIAHVIWNVGWRK